MIDRITPARIAGTFEASFDLLPREVEAFLRQGISADTLAGPMPVRAGYVVFSESGFEFEHHDHSGGKGVRAFLFLIGDPHGVARDLVVWAPMLGRLDPWLGRSWALGEEQIYRPRLTDHQALSVWRSPIEWLQAGRKGVCFVQPKVAHHYLWDAGPLLAEDLAHGAELNQLLTCPPPRILVPASSLEEVNQP